MASDLVSDYDFELPPELIAQSPLAVRSSAKLLVVRLNPSGGLPRFEDLTVNDLPEIVDSEPSLRAGPWVRNRSKVLPARFYARRPTGSLHEIVLLEEIGPHKWKAIIRGTSSFKYPQTLVPVNSPELELVSPELGVLDFSSLKRPITEWLREVGEMPLPPYIKDRSHARDVERYQPVWAASDKEKSAAAPTASLHFTSELVEKMSEQGIEWLDTFLHVGLGTFEPVRVEKLSEHNMHGENFEIPTESLQKLIGQKRVCTAVGTTALRALESIPTNLWNPNENLIARTHLFVKPGFEFRFTKNLLTNFHLPQSTLFVLVSTFCGSLTLAKEAYAHAVQRKYRFFSYGDATLWIG